MKIQIENKTGLTKPYPNKLPKYFPNPGGGHLVQNSHTLNI